MTDRPERRHLGHLITGLSLMTDDGAGPADVFFVCTEMGSIPSDVLAEINADGRAVPPLDSCGHRHLK